MPFYSRTYFIYDAAGNAMNDDRGAAGNYAYAYDQAGNMAELSRDGLTLARYTRPMGSDCR